jgi:hypothetical protein
MPRASPESSRPWLVFPIVDDAGRPNLDPAAGAVQWWFTPYWSSVAVGGAGGVRGGAARALGLARRGLAPGHAELLGQGHRTIP